VPPETIPDLLSARARASPDAPAFLSAGAAGTWQPVTWREFAADVDRLSGALHRAGVTLGTRVGIVARTSVDWERAQMAALAVGALVVGIDPNYPAETLARVLESTAPEVLFVDDEATVARLPPAAHARLVLAFRGADGGVARSLAAFTGDGHRNEPPEQRPVGDTDAIVAFSSGTTEFPKPIVYTHRQVLLAVEAILASFAEIDGSSRLACWLPLANLFQRIINFCAMARGASSYVVPDPREVVEHLGTIRPHVFIGVPRFFEKVQAGIAERIGGDGWFMAAVAHWAIDQGRMGASGKRSGVFERLRFGLADRAVLRRVRAVFGGEARYLISGSAPMPVWLLEWFDAIGLPVFEAYGISECIVPIAMNRPGARRLGTVGQPMATNDVRLGADGEVLVRGPGVFKGYMGSGSGSRPNADGFWATGDLGEVTPEGYLRLTGRKSDTFKTSGGRWVVPARVEASLRRTPYVEHAVVLRAGADAVVAIINVDLARLRGAPAAPEVALSAAERERVVRDAAAALADVPAHARPTGFLVVTTPFSTTAGDLTTNLKLRRAAIAARFAPDLERLLAIPAPAVLVA